MFTYSYWEFSNWIPVRGKHNTTFLKGTAMPEPSVLNQILVLTFLIVFAVFCSFIALTHASRLARATVLCKPSVDLPEYSVIDDTINVLRLLRDRLRDEQRHSVEPNFYDRRLLVLAEAIDELEAMQQP